MTVIRMKLLAVLLSTSATGLLAAAVAPERDKIALAGTGATHVAQVTESVETSAGKRLMALLKAANEDDLRLNPQVALSRGDLRYAGEFGDLISDAFYREAEANLRKQLREAKAIDRAALNTGERIAYDVFRYQVELALRQYDEGHVMVSRQLPVDHLLGQHLAFQQLSSGGGTAPFNSVADYEASLSRFNGFVTYLDRAVDRMREGIAAKRVQPRHITKKVIAQLDQVIGVPITESPFYQPLKTFPADFDAGVKARLDREFRNAIDGKIRPALKRLRDFMQAEYLPAGSARQYGVSAMPGGTAYYDYMVESFATIPMPADEIHKIGLAEVARIRSEMQQIMKRVGFKGTLLEFFTFLRSDRRFKLASKDALLQYYRDIQHRVDAVMPKYFHAQPRSKFEVRPYPPEQESSGGGAYYVIGTSDGKRPGVFFVNTSNLQTHTTPRATALFLHEAIPGHHLQGSLAMESEHLPEFLRYTWNAGYGEGWGLYCEWLGKEMGLYDDPYQDFGRLDMEMIRATRLVVDTGLHVKGWSRDKAIRYLLANTSLDRNDVEQAVDRYIVWPGQAVAYKIGDLFIRAQRKKAEAALGTAFDIRDFHDQVLASGALPLRVLERKIDDWITARRSGGGTSASAASRFNGAPGARAR